MRPYCLFAALLFALPTTLAAPAPKDDPVKTDLAKMAGKWRVVERIVAGTALSEEALANYPTFTLTGVEYQWEGYKTPNGKILRLDPSSKPKEIDFEMYLADMKKQKEFGIYEITGDTYRDCVAPNAGPRPTKFESTAENSYVLVTCKRVKE